jgi:hypothetical protein
MDDLVRRVRELHRPRWYNPYSQSGQVWLVCHGCDEGGHAEAPASWPCRTAEIVYTAEEIEKREPKIAECPEDHRTYGEGPPVRAQAVFLLCDGQLVAARWKCDHVPPVPVESGDPW